MENIINSITNDELSLDELSEVAKTVLSKIYSKLVTEVGMNYPSVHIQSIGRDSYDVNIIFVNNVGYSGESYEMTYNI